MASSSPGTFPRNTSLLCNKEQKRVLQARTAPTTSSSSTSSAWTNSKHVVTIFFLKPFHNNE